jgi:hypothetical protein
MGLVAFAFAAVLQVISRIISMGPATWAAEQRLDVTDPTLQAFSRFDDGLSVGFFILGFLSVGLYGMAMTQTPGARKLGWPFVAVGMLGVVLGVFGAGIPAFVFFGTAALGVTTQRVGVPTRNTQNT